MKVLSRPKCIGLYGVKTNNLKNISCEIPMRSLTVLTGVSGSGKSSLAFDTLYAEGQRRFLESMSTYVRMFLDEMPKPPVDKVENCLPAIALRQQSSFNHPRSTVATVTELLVHMAQLYANAGKMTCMRCGGKVLKDTETEMENRFRAYGQRIRMVVFVEVRLSPGETAAQRLTALAAGGYQRLWINQKVVELSQGDIESLLDSDCFCVLIDRLSFDPAKGLDGRMSEAFEAAFDLGDGRFYVDVLLPEKTETLMFDRRYVCHRCGEVYKPLRPELFDPNSTLGACPTCTGFGSVSGIDWQRVIRNGLSIEDDAIIPFKTPTAKARKTQLLGFCARQKIPTDKPFSSLTQEQQQLVKFGKMPYRGVMGFFEMLQSKSNKFTARIQLARYRGYSPCEVCDGTGLSDLSRSVRVMDRIFSDILNMTVDQALAFFESIPAECIQSSGSQTPYDNIMLRLRTLHGVGLGYLNLNRKSKTLSGGESQRLHLSCGLGRGLTDTLYVLDEPTAGLHPVDSARLTRVLRDLQDLGNTLVVVEHDTEVIEQADHVIELGPGGGELGGQIIYEGDLDGLKKSHTPTGEMLRSEARVRLNAQSLPTKKYINIENASIHNLKNLKISIPLGQLVTIAGVSGSGKSTLIHDVLYQNWLMYSSEKSGLEENADDGDEEVDTGVNISGFDYFDEIVMMEQGALGRSLRACVATMTKAYTGIRQLMARQPEAVEIGMTAGHFSFNMDLGRCPECEGLGFKTIEMMFMNDLTVPCTSCGGKRFKPEVLGIRYGGLNIAEILNMTVTEAARFFESYNGIAEPLKSLCDVGLGYIRLGQSTSTLSGGEFQRLRLSSYLERASADNARTLFIFDEPTVGLHMQDVACLIGALQRLVSRSASVIVIEHNLDVIAQSHVVIELGPCGGPDGGHVVFTGTPALLAGQSTPTGRALARWAGCSD